MLVYWCTRLGFSPHGARGLTIGIAGYSGALGSLLWQVSHSVLIYVVGAQGFNVKAQDLGKVNTGVLLSFLDCESLCPFFLLLDIFALEYVRIPAELA
jgi:hypothetical protein